MARRNFWSGPADYVVNVSTGKPIVGATVTFWTLSVGGTQITDLKLLNSDGSLGASVTSLTTDSNGFVPSFAGPPDGTAQLWADAGIAAGRKMMNADLPVAAGDGTNLMKDDGTTTPASGFASSTHGHTTLADLPPGSVFYRRYSGSWPVRGSTRTDLMCIWVKNAVADPDPAIDSTYALSPVDVLWRMV